MKSFRPRILAFLILVFALLGYDRAWAQAPLEPAQMSARTLFYMIWRGAPVGDIRKSNNLLALWDDPDLAPVRAAMFQNIQSGSEKDSTKPPLTREEAEETSSLLENAFVFGYIRKPETKAAAKPTDRPWNGLFLVYDRTGKEAVLAKTILRARMREKDPAQISQITVAGAPAMKIERKDNVTYLSEHGKYAVVAGELGVFEEILGRLDNKSPAASSLAQTAAYQEAQPLIQGGLIEFFLRIPQLKDFAPAATADAPVRIGPVLDALKVDAIHSLCGRITLEGSKARVQGAILGDAAPGTLFDLWNNGQQTPASLSFVSPESVSYSETQFNLSALYGLLKRALRVALPQNQQGGAEMMEGLAASRIGMPVPDALALFSGEFASIQSNPGMDPQKAVYYLGIRNKQDTLKLLRSIFGDQLGSERNEGDTTFVKVSLGGGQNSTGIAQWNFYNLAVTPTFVLASSRGETLRESLVKYSHANSAQAPVLPVAFQSARAQFPAAIGGLAFMDLQKVDYQALKTRWIEQAKKSSPTPSKKSPSSTSQSGSSQVPDWLLNINPEVFPRHLHYLAGASWKDSKGIHFDEWLE